jgi:hypothetical protein
VIPRFNSNRLLSWASDGEGYTNSLVESKLVSFLGLFP